jgi:hypothetical protein
MGEKRNASSILIEKSEREHLLGDLDVDAKINLKLILKK